MRVISEYIQSIKTLMDEIASASVQQSEMIVSVENRIKEVSKVTESNSAAAQESAVISNQLSHQARTLNQLIGRFCSRSSQILQQLHRESRLHMHFSSGPNIFTGPEITSLATYKTLSTRASMVHFTRVSSPRSTSMQVIQRGWTQLPVL